MAAVNTAVVSNLAVRELSKRSNWAGKEAGVVVVFCVVFVVAVGLISVFVTRKLKARRERKAIQAAKSSQV